MNRRRIFVFGLMLSLLAFYLSGCAENRTGGQNSFYSTNTYPADAVFESFYRRLGGAEMLGPCLSPKFEYDGRFYQYTAAVLMVYDPNAPSSLQRYQLAPLANEMGIGDPPQAKPEDGHYYRNGHRIWEEVMPWYERWGGNLVGAPLTEVHYNAELHRYEQYFENVGFYRLENDPAKTIHLLAYGAWKCDKMCSYLSVTDMAGPHEMPPQPTDELLFQADTAFNVIAARLGAELTGYPISETYLADDGNIEKIYEYLVLYIDPADASRPMVRPLSKILHVPVDELEPRNIEMYFYPVEEGKGYNVPSYFMDFITRHGGMEISGMPITREYFPNHSVSRQCYTNFCLEYHRSAPEILRVRPSAQGYIYKDLHYRLKQPTAVPILQSASLKTWEQTPLLPSGQSQIIFAAVYDNNNPVRGVSLRLTVTMPDGSQPSFMMPPTDANGQTSVSVGSIVGQNGTLVPYQVCVATAATATFCDTEGFVIWESP